MRAFQIDSFVLEKFHFLFFLLEKIFRAMFSIAYKNNTLHLMLTTGILAFVDDIGIGF